MNGLVETICRSQAIAIAAKAEQERFGHHAIDLEHLFVGLMTTRGTAGCILSSMGVTLRAVRQAAGRANLGRITSFGPEPHTADPSEARWTERAQKLLQDVDVQDDDRALLLALIDEPSGHITCLLGHLSLTPDAVREAAVAYRHGTPPQFSLACQDLSLRHSSGRTFTHIAYLPCRPEAVWDLVSDPSRRLEWDGHFFESFEQRADGVLVGTARLTKPDGRRRRVRTGIITSEMIVSSCDPGKFIEWESIWPDMPDVKFRRRFSLRISATDNGTRLIMTHNQLTYPGFVARLRLPLAGIHTKQSLVIRAAAIDRALR